MKETSLDEIVITGSAPEFGDTHANRTIGTGLIGVEGRMHLLSTSFMSVSGFAGADLGKGANIGVEGIGPSINLPSALKGKTLGDTFALTAKITAQTGGIFYDGTKADVRIGAETESGWGLSVGVNGDHSIQLEKRIPLGGPK